MCQGGIEERGGTARRPAAQPRARTSGPRPLGPAERIGVPPRPEGAGRGTEGAGPGPGDGGSAVALQEPASPAKSGRGAFAARPAGHILPVVQGGRRGGSGGAGVVAIGGVAAVYSRLLPQAAGVDGTGSLRARLRRTSARREEVREDGNQKSLKKRERMISWRFSSIIFWNAIEKQVQVPEPTVFALETLRVVEESYRDRLPVKQPWVYSGIKEGKNAV